MVTDVDDVDVDSVLVCLAQSPVMHRATMRLEQLARLVRFNRRLSPVVSFTTLATANPRFLMDCGNGFTGRKPCGFMVPCCAIKRLQAFNSGVPELLTMLSNQVNMPRVTFSQVCHAMYGAPWQPTPGLVNAKVARCESRMQAVQPQAATRGPTITIHLTAFHVSSSSACNGVVLAAVPPQSPLPCLVIRPSQMAGPSSLPPAKGCSRLLRRSCACKPAEILASKRNVSGLQSLYGAQQITVHCCVAGGTCQLFQEGCAVGDGWWGQDKQIRYCSRCSGSTVCFHLAPHG